MRLRYFFGLFAALLFAACSVDVDVDYDTSKSPTTIQVTWMGAQASSIVEGQVVGLTSGTGTSGASMDEVAFKAYYKEGWTFEAEILLPKRLPSTARVMIGGNSYSATMDSQRVIKITM